MSKTSLAVYGTWFALIVDIDDYEGEFYPETKQPTDKMIRVWIKEQYGFSVNSASISQTKKKYGLIADTEGHYVQKVRPEKEAAIREAFIWFGILKNSKKDVSGNVWTSFFAHMRGCMNQCRHNQTWRKRSWKTSQFSSRLFTQEGYCLRHFSPNWSRASSASSKVTAV